MPLHTRICVESPGWWCEKPIMQNAWPTTFHRHRQVPENKTSDNTKFMPLLCPSFKHVPAILGTSPSYILIQHSFFDHLCHLTRIRGLPRRERSRFIRESVHDWIYSAFVGRCLVCLAGYPPCLPCVLHPIQSAKALARVHVDWCPLAGQSMYGPSTS